MRAVEEARHKLKPPQLLNVDTPTIDGKRIGIVRIGKSALSPVFADAGGYIRRGEATQPMTPETLIERVQQVSEQLNLAMARHSARQTEMIEKLGEDLAAAHSWKGQCVDWLIGGIIEAIIGAILTGRLTLVIG